MKMFRLRPGLLFPPFWGEILGKGASGASRGYFATIYNRLIVVTINSTVDCSSAFLRHEQLFELIEGFRNCTTQATGIHRCKSAYCRIR